MSRLRTFIAVEVGRALRGQLAELQETLARSADAVKWVEEENLHVTLLFLGDVDDRAVIDVCRSAGRVCASVPSFQLRVEGVGAFPNAQRPRTIWAGVGTGAEELVALHGALETALIDLGCYRREERRFTPHITLGRVTNESVTDQLPEALAKQAGWVGGECEVAKVLVMSSQLTPRGPIYSVMSTARLG